MDPRRRSPTKEREVNVYRISAFPTRMFDYYRAAVVVAESPESAARIHPNGIHVWSTTGWPRWVGDWVADTGTWVTPEKVTVELIASAPEQTAARVLCANYVGR